MKIEGRYTFLLPIHTVYEALRDEALIREALPGHVYFRQSSPTRYEAAMELDVPRFGGHYEGAVEVLETRAPTFYRLSARGHGAGRELSAQGTVTLHATSATETEVHYVGSTDALRDSNRLVQMAAAPIAAHLVGRGLNHLEQVIAARAARTSAPNDL